MIRGVFPPRAVERAHGARGGVAAGNQRPGRFALRRAVRRSVASGKTPKPLTSVELTRWAEALYSASASEPPLRGAILTIEQLELHARTLAATHRVAPRRGSGRLLKRLTDSEQVILQCHALMSEAHAGGRRLTPAAEWLLDNHYLIEEQIHLARKHCPPGYSRQLPRLAGGESPGLPRVYDLIQELISHVDGRVDDDALSRYLAAYQSVTHLTLGELWSVPIMLRLALVENLRRVAQSVSWQRAHRDSALAWAQRINSPGEGHESALLVLADMVREDPPFSTAFVAQFTQALQGGGGAPTGFVTAWLEHRLAERGQTIEEVVRCESRSQAADQASMANSIASLRFVNATEWHTFVEAQSATEQILRGEPSGVYGAMDFATRDSYRHVVEALARRRRIDEEEVARTAVALAAEAHARDSDGVGAHVGYLLVDEGRPQLERALRDEVRPRLLRPRLVRNLKLLAYLGPVALFTAAAFAWVVHRSATAALSARVALALAAAVAASQCAIALVNWVASVTWRPRGLPRLDFEHGIPDACRTLVIVPTLLTRPERIAELIEGLELRYLANRDPNLWFGLLTDFGDAKTEHLPGDEELLERASGDIRGLNDRYGGAAPGRFFLFHRPRLFNQQEGCWMGRERKRGKLEDLNALLCGEDRQCFSRIVGDASELDSVRYVITLDTDTNLPWGAGWRLVGAAAHPLHRPRLDLAKRRLLRGYAILQPRVASSLQSSQQSHYARLLAGEVGLDPYTRVVSDLYQDLFGEASFIGKGIYDVGAFRRLLDGRFPDNTVLSHDLLESCYARTGQCSDVELLEDSPSRYLTDVSRRHRWMRGDWQIAPWLGTRTSDAAGQRLRPWLAALGWWKIFDNLRRAFLAPAYVLLFLLGWLVLPAPVSWTLGVLALLLGPELLPGLAELTQRPAKLPWRLHLATVARSTARRLSKMTLWVAFLPFEAVVALDAALRSLWRMFFSHKRLLEWQTAAAAESGAASRFGPVLQRMWVAPAVAIATAAFLATRAPAKAGVSASLVLVLWLLSPLIAWWVSRPVRPPSSRLAAEEVGFLRQVARLTWRYFEVFVGPRDNWLPPDNVQELPGLRVAHRTSPTDLGLSLLSNLAAHDLGYLSGGQLLDRTARSIESMETLERHRGHFFNWYETETRKPLAPLYVSSVDSGNLVGHVRVLRSGLLELATAPALPARALDGLRDTFGVLTAQLGGRDEPQARCDPEAFATCSRLLETRAHGLSATRSWLEVLSAASARLAESCDRQRHPEASWWASAFDRHARAFLADLTELAPWLALPPDPRDADTARCLAELDGAATLEALGRLAQQAAETLGADGALGSVRPENPRAALLEALRLGAEAVFARLQQLETLGQRCLGLADAEFSFLFDRQRKLLAIGYWVTERRLDKSFYDLLASEARLASYLAIASGELPFEHWFALGRRLTTARGKQALLSWSGSMFEYLMPLLVMPAYEGTLLHETCAAAVAHQIAYGRQRGVPWGVSESCFGLTDVEGTYQYRAFGVPGLGLQRGLGDDLVISPYASTLALLVDPERACANLRRLSDEACVGAYGFYEAVDFTPTRVPEGQRSTLVRSYMVHHHGMSLLALGQAVLGPEMQRRFLSNPELRAATLLLQERIPKVHALIHPHAREAQVSRRVVRRGPETVNRVLTNPNTPIPEVQLLSNGRYHVMVSAAGAGYSRWNDLAVTRWREDPTSETFGVFCFVGDRATHRSWSSAYQPLLHAGRHYEAIFTPGRAEFRRQDDQIETHTEIAVSAEDDLEIRRLRLTNRSASPRALQVTAYAEVVLAPGVADELHRAFSNLFVHAELVPEHGALLMTRRPRSAEERPPWMFCMLQARSADAGPCSYELERVRAIGRGRSLRRPAFLDDFGPLSGQAGALLDPCVAARRAVELAVDGKVQLDLVIGAAATREAALALVLKYQDHRMADRVFEAAGTHSRAALGHLGASEREALQYAQLASAVIFPVGAYRAPGSILLRNRKGQSGLWGHTISGDLPIVLLRVSDAENLHLVRTLLGAHAYWRTRGLLTDLVIWNEDASGYRRVLNDQIMGLIASGTEAQLVDRPGGVFVRHLDTFPEEDRVLLQAVARIVIRDGEGPLEQQLERWREASLTSRPPMLALARPAPSPPPAEPSGSVRRDLIFSNGTGGFTQDGREYIVDLPPGRQTPAPWVNVIANAQLGTVVSESGSAYTWYGNSQLYRLTPWSNDAVSDPSGEAIYLRDDEGGQTFSPTPGPRPGEGPYACRHGFGYSVFEHQHDGLQTELTTYVAIEAPVKFWALKIRNLSGRSRSVSVFAAVDLVLGDLRSRQAMHVITELDPLTGAILARNSYSSDFPETVAFFDCSETVRSVSGDRAEFLGRNGDPSSPAALRLRRLSGRLGPGLDPCAAMQTRLELPEGAEREVVFILGAAPSAAEAVALVQRHRGRRVARVALEEVWRYWNDKLGVLHAETPDAAVNVLLNGWLPYQVLSCRMWGRSGFYQSGGAYGFRDQLQDCVALLHQTPELSREHLLRSAARQFVEGDVHHWWHPPKGRGVRTSCSDDYLWLPYAVCRYVAFTGDTGVLDEQVPFLAGRQLTDGEESYYDLPSRSDQSGTLYEHCARALLNGLRVGAHGLPLMGSGDWNDGMNRVGHRGKGESVWLGFFLHHVLSQFATLAAARGDEPFARRCGEAAGALEAALETHAWDGEWYRRAYFDDGEPLGSAGSAECRIDALPQAWATIAEVGAPGRRRLALDAVWSELVCQEPPLVKLFAPPFERSAQEPGYIKGYPAGVRENGGQYTHGAVWAALAFALAGRSEQAAALVSLLNPINHALDPAGVDRYKVEPYVLAADVYSHPAWAGRGGWTWYTGSAAWFYRLLHEVILGLERRVDRLHVQPRVPAAWTSFKVHYRYYATFYHLLFTQDPLHAGPPTLTLDGATLAGNVLPLADDRRDHTVEVRFGPSAAEGPPATVRAS
ncbi:MAG: cyclic beta 1-2 glucan synthetase [Deltaproteobacteria bacterium]|nr:cyclic beta 1-2 glucan synthetase [Deltaproteobacteria bacterium]